MLQELLKNLHSEFIYVKYYLEWKFLFHLFAIIGAVVIFLIVRNPLKKLLSKGPKYEKYFDFIFKIGFLYGLIISIWGELIDSFNHLPILSTVLCVSILWFVLTPFAFNATAYIQLFNAILNKSYQVGDNVRIGEYIGRIRKIGPFSIQLFHEDGNLIVVPLKYFLGHPLTVIKSKNFAIYEETFQLSDGQIFDAPTLEKLKFKIINLPYDIDMSAFHLTSHDGQVHIKIKFWPSFVEESLKKNVSKIISEMI